ncbi:hypothetical protein [Anatilimnocola floriformis]|uniref:hypothetical protein n=1 Tax=Anatilimnocola floriformis TaxID=2948575 RepID=UPI0020C2F356|nr:hypothetical protein [Anatilimnocola floriformis]
MPNLCLSCGGPVVGSYDLDSQCEDCVVERFHKFGLRGLHHEPSVYVSLAKNLEALAEDSDEPTPPPAPFTFANAIEQIQEEFS